MARFEAERWAERSSERRPLYHATSRSAAQAIRQSGFDLDRWRHGRIWGNGIYTSPDVEVARHYAALYAGDAEVLELRALLGPVLKVDPRGGDRTSLARQVLLAIPGGYARFVELTVLLRGGRPPAIVAAEAMTRVLVESGYDGLEIVEAGFTPAVGGNQIVVFDPRRVVVIDE